MRTFNLGLVVGLLLTLITGWGFAAKSPSPWYTLNANKEATLQVDVFVSSTCSHCQKLEDFLKEKAKENPWLNVRYHVINENKKALKTYARFLKQQGSSDFAVPSVFFCKTRWLGFDTAATSGPLLMNNLEYCRNQIQKEGKLSNKSVDLLQQVSKSNFYAKSLSGDTSALERVFILSFMDVLTPQTAFVILSLFCFMVIQKEGSLRPLSGLLFVLGVGLAHAFQQRYTVNFYDVMAQMRIPSLLLGLGLLTYLLAFHPRVFVFKRSLPMLVTFLWIFLTGMAVQAYQQLHVPNFSLIFAQWVVAQNFNASQIDGYFLINQLIYLSLVALFAWMLFIMLSNYGKWSRHQRIVEEFAWQYLIIIAGTLCLYPYLLASHWYSFLIFIVALLGSWLGYRYWSRKHHKQA